MSDFRTDVLLSKNKNLSCPLNEELALAMSHKCLEDELFGRGGIHIVSRRQLLTKLPCHGGTLSNQHPNTCYLEPLLNHLDRSSQSLGTRRILSMRIMSSKIWPSSTAATPVQAMHYMPIIKNRSGSRDSLSQNRHRHRKKRSLTNSHGRRRA